MKPKIGPGTRTFFQIKFVDINKNAIFKYYEHLFKQQKLRQIACADDLLDISVLRPFSKLPKYTSHFTRINKNCTTQRFIIVTVNIIFYRLYNEKDLQYYGHRNIVIIDNKKKEFELFEPNAGLPFGEPAFGSFHEIVEKVIRKRYKLNDYTYFPSIKFCPNAGPQKKIKGNYLSDTCQYFSAWYTELRLKNPNASRNSIINKMLSKSPKQMLIFMEQYIDMFNDLGIVLVEHVNNERLEKKRKNNLKK